MIVSISLHKRSPVLHMLQAGPSPLEHANTHACRRACASALRRTLKRYGFILACCSVWTACVQCRIEPFRDDIIAFRDRAHSSSSSRPATRRFSSSRTIWCFMRLSGMLLAGEGPYSTYMGATSGRAKLATNRETRALHRRARFTWSCTERR